MAGLGPAMEDTEAGDFPSVEGLLGSEILGGRCREKRGRDKNAVGNDYK